MNTNVYPLTIYYDGACRLCDAEMTNLKLPNFDNKLRFVNLNEVDASGLPEGVSWQMAMSLIQAKRADGQIVSGVEVFRWAYEAVGGYVGDTMDDVACFGAFGRCGLPMDCAKSPLFPKLRHQTVV